METIWTVIAVLIVLILVGLLLSWVKIVQQAEALVIERLGA